MIQLPKGTKLEGVLVCSSNFIFYHYTVNHPNMPRYLAVSRGYSKTYYLYGSFK